MGVSCREPFALREQERHAVHWLLYITGREVFQQSRKVQRAENVIECITGKLKLVID